MLGRDISRPSTWGGGLLRGEEGARETACSGPPRGASPAAGVTCCVSINSFFKERDTLPQQEVVAGLPQPRAASGGESGAPGGSAQGAEKPRSPAASRLRRAARMGPWPARRAVAGAEGSGRRGGRRGPHPLARGDPPASPARPRGGRGRAGVAGRVLHGQGRGRPRTGVLPHSGPAPKAGGAAPFPPGGPEAACHPLWPPGVALTFSFPERTAS